MKNKQAMHGVYYLSDFGEVKNKVAFFCQLKAYLACVADIWVHLVEYNFNLYKIMWKKIVPKENTCSGLKFGMIFMTTDK